LKVFKLYSLLLFLTVSLLAGVENRYPNLALVNSGIKIIDIRTQGEWAQTGLLPNSYPITFFNAQGNYNVSTFINTLNKVVNKNQTFAILCRSGSRSKTVSNFLKRNGYKKVINLTGGINYSIRLGMTTETYNQFKRYY